MSDGRAAVLVAAIAVLLLGGSALLSTTNIRPYDEDAILKQIADEDSTLCSKFGLQAASQEFGQCVADLADLRQRHEQLLIAHSWI